MRRQLGLSLTLVLLVALGCTAKHSSGSSGSATTTAGSSGRPVPPPGSQKGLKPVLVGLADRQGEPPTQFVGALRGWVVNVKWSDLEPTPNGPIVVPNAIDQAISAARQLNVTHPGLNLGLRIRTGVAAQAPAWLKDQGGPSITVSNPHGGQTAQIGRFWTAQYGTAYANFEAKLAALYDGVPEVREVDVSRCSTIFDETFERGARDPATAISLFGAGFTVALDMQCHRAQLQEMTVWQSTRVDYSFNPYQVLSPDGSHSSPDEGFTEQMMQDCRDVLGQRCVLFNESIRYPISKLGHEYEQMYAKMKQLGRPIGFQTATSARVGDLAKTIDWARTEGAENVELPTQYKSTAPTALAGLSPALSANAPPGG